jgi:CubicO group peptidase (beta-lactamase class C family)
VYERVGGSPQAQADFFADEIGTPLALEATTLEPDASGVPVGSSFVYAPARDWARFGLLLLDGGQINGQGLLSEDWVQRATTPNQSDNDPRYGYQIVAEWRRSRIALAFTAARVLCDAGQPLAIRDGAAFAAGGRRAPRLECQ